MMLSTKLSLVFLQFLIEICYSCKCARFETDNDGYCKSDWISNVKILTKHLDQNERTVVYKLEHLQILKAHVRSELVPKILETSADSKSCGETGLKPGNEYVLAGEISTNESLSINTCSWKLPSKFYVNNNGIIDLLSTWQEFIQGEKCL